MTIKVPAVMQKKFRDQLNDISLKRDSFLASMIERELPRLSAELKGKVLSSRARRYIAGSLKRMGTKRVNVVISKSAAKALRKCVKDHGIVRDAFVSRLIVLLRSEKALLTLLDLPEQVNQKRFHTFVEDMPTSPLKAIEAVTFDPLYYLRVAMEERHGCGLYLARLPRNLAGLSCYLLDEDVPGTAAWKAREAEAAELLDEPATGAKRA